MLFKNIEAEDLVLILLWISQILIYVVQVYKLVVREIFLVCHDFLILGNPFLFLIYYLIAIEFSLYILKLLYVYSTTLSDFKFEI